MQSQNIIRLKTPVNLNNNYNLENKDTFELNKKPKNIFREYSNIANKKNYYFPKSSIYRSFINSSAPFNYTAAGDNSPVSRPAIYSSSISPCSRCTSTSFFSRLISSTQSSITGISTSPNSGLFTT